MDTSRNRDRRRRKRSESPHERGKPKSHRFTEECRRHKRKERETEYSDRDKGGSSSDKFDKTNNFYFSKLEGKAKEKMSVLSKLGIQLKPPEAEKKKRLWSDKKEPGSSVWNSAHFDDNKATAKFKRLMGIKEEAVKPNPSSGSDISRTQAELFEKMEEEYEVARLTTHSMRGVGLGFPK